MNRKPKIIAPTLTLTPTSPRCTYTMWEGHVIWWDDPARGTFRTVSREVSESTARRFCRKHKIPMPSKTP